MARQQPSQTVDEEEAREQAMQRIMMADLGAASRNAITSTDPGYNDANVAQINQSRLSNQRGTEENVKARRNKGALAAWGTLVRADEVGNDEEDINHGQSHRVHLRQSLAISKHGEEYRHRSACESSIRRPPTNHSNFQPVLPSDSIVPSRAFSYAPLDPACEERTMSGTYKYKATKSKSKSRSMSDREDMPPKIDRSPPAGFTSGILPRAGQTAQRHVQPAPVTEQSGRSSRPVRRSLRLVRQAQPANSVWADKGLAACPTAPLPLPAHVSVQEKIMRAVEESCHSPESQTGRLTPYKEDSPIGGREEFESVSESGRLSEQCPESVEEFQMDRTLSLEPSLLDVDDGLTSSIPPLPLENAEVVSCTAAFDVWWNNLTNRSEKPAPTATANHARNPSVQSNTAWGPPDTSASFLPQTNSHTCTWIAREATPAIKVAKNTRELQKSKYADKTTEVPRKNVLLETSSQEDRVTNRPISKVTEDLEVSKVPESVGLSASPALPRHSRKSSSGMSTITNGIRNMDINSRPASQLTSLSVQQSMPHVVPRPAPKPETLHKQSLNASEQAFNPRVSKATSSLAKRPADFTTQASSCQQPKSVPALLDGDIIEVTLPGRNKMNMSRKEVREMALYMNSLDQELDDVDARKKPGLADD